MASAVEIDLAVRNLTGRYCDAVARFDVPAFTACWTLDAAWIVPNVRTFTGRDEIVRVFAKLRAPFRYCIQELLSGVITPAGEGSGATARWQIRELQWRAGAGGNHPVT
jgi:ketosteroid isomerase-like protein